MNRISQLDPARVPGETRLLLAGVQATLGSVPNLIRVLSHSSAALKAYLTYEELLKGGSLPEKTRSQIALVVAEINDCDYCRNAHAHLGAQAGLTDRQISDARQVSARDGHTAAILNLTRAIVIQRGALSDTEFQTARSAPLTDEEIIETVANVGLNILANYINHVAKTVIDFPANRAEAHAPGLPSISIGE